MVLRGRRQVYTVEWDKNLERKFALFGPLSRHQFGHLVGGRYTTGPATLTHWQSNEPVFSTRRDRPDQISDN